jgi:hypothetical protein
MNVHECDRPYGYVNRIRPFGIRYLVRRKQMLKAINRPPNLDLEARAGLVA